VKVMTVLGTRPEIIRLSRIIPALDGLAEHVLVHSSQNFDPKLNDLFFSELGVRAPDHVFACRSDSMMGQVATILTEAERLLAQERPDRLLILGDTNTGLAALAAKRLGIPVYHMEAGNRCFDDRVPEEVNRRVIDHCSDVLMPYTERSRANLLREGIPADRVFVTGNPIREVLAHYAPRIAASRILSDLGLSPRRFFLVTMHRAENVDVPERLGRLVAALRQVHAEHGLPVVYSVHPRARARARERGVTLDGGGLVALEPLGLFDFVHLEQHAACVLTDSGTVQEECCLFSVPNVTIRDVTERPETIEVGSNVLSGDDPGRIASCVRAAMTLAPRWQPPPEYGAPDVTATVCKLLLGFALPHRG
jgi:UDP-N-acetylglucosamine 2-epimerase (non-hydrolysing)